MPVGDLFEIVTVSRFQDQTGLNVSHWRIESISGSTPTDTVIAAAMNSHLEDEHVNLMSEEASYRGLTLQYLGPGDPREKVIHANGGEPGTIEGEPLPSQVAGLITLRTGLAGRANRGRKYFPFAGETANLTGGVPSAAYLLSLGDAVTAYSADVLAGTPPVSALLHCYILRKSDLHAVRVTTGTVRPNWATQRRRSRVNRPDLATF